MRESDYPPMHEAVKALVELHEAIKALVFCVCGHERIIHLTGPRGAEDACAACDCGSWQSTKEASK